MPLLATTTSPWTDNQRNGISFWMSVQGAPIDQPILVCATYSALTQLDPSQIGDLHGAWTIFDEHKILIEAVASNHFDANGVGTDGGL